MMAEKKTATIVVRVTPDTKEDFFRIAHAAGKTGTEVLAEMIESYIED